MMVNSVRQTYQRTVEDGLGMEGDATNNPPSMDRL